MICFDRRIDIAYVDKLYRRRLYCLAPYFALQIEHENLLIRISSKELCQFSRSLLRAVRVPLIKSKIAMGYRRVTGITNARNRIRVFLSMICGQRSTITCLGDSYIAE